MFWIVDEIAIKLRIAISFIELQTRKVIAAN